MSLAFCESDNEFSQELWMWDALLTLSATPTSHLYCITTKRTTWLVRSVCGVCGLEGLAGCGYRLEQVWGGLVGLGEVRCVGCIWGGHMGLGWMCGVGWNARRGTWDACDVLMCVWDGCMAEMGVCGGCGIGRVCRLGWVCPWVEFYPGRNNCVDC